MLDATSAAFIAASTASPAVEPIASRRSASTGRAIRSLRSYAASLLAASKAASLATFSSPSSRASSIPSCAALPTAFLASSDFQSTRTKVWLAISAAKARGSKLPLCIFHTSFRIGLHRDLKQVDCREKLRRDEGQVERKDFPTYSLSKKRNGSTALT